MEQVLAKDDSSESIETIAPFMTIIGVDIQLVSCTLPNAPLEVISKDFLEKPGTSEFFFLARHFRATFGF